MNKKMKVLIAEDNDLMRKSLAFYLKDEGFQVLEVTNGKEALQAVESHQIELVITDLNMPESGGLELIHTIRDVLKKDMPIIVLTASGVEKSELEAFELGASEFISKPFSPHVLKARIKKLLNV